MSSVTRRSARGGARAPGRPLAPPRRLSRSRRARETTGAAGRPRRRRSGETCRSLVCLVCEREEQETGDEDKVVVDVEELEGGGEESIPLTEAEAREESVVEALVRDVREAGDNFSSTVDRIGERERAEDTIEYKLARRKLRTAVEELQRELVRQELKSVIKDVESDLQAEEEELDAMFGMTFGMDPQTINYVSVTFLTLAVAWVAWAIEFALGEDTSWWWSLPLDPLPLLALTTPPLLVAGIAMIPALEPFVSRVPNLREYLDQAFSHNTDLDEPEEALPLGTYVCFDTVIIGSELVVALGFFQGLLLKYLGAWGWTAESHFKDYLGDDMATRVLGGIVDTLPLTTFTVGPLVVVAVSAVLTEISKVLNEADKEDAEVLSDLAHGSDRIAEVAESSIAQYANDAELKPLLAYLKTIDGKGARRGGRGEGEAAEEEPGKGGTAAWRAAELLARWQSKRSASIRFVWIEAAYWVYLTSEVACTHSLVPAVLTALSLEGFSWYKLWRSIESIEEEDKEKKV